MRIPTTDDLDAQEDAVRARAAALPADKRRRFHDRRDRAARDPDTYSALNWSLGVGLHHFYMGDHLRGVVTLAVTALALIALASALWPLGALALLAVAALELRELVFARRICRARNLAHARGILDELERGG